MPHRTLQKDGTVVEGFAERDVVDALHGPTGNKEPLIVCASDPSSQESADSTTDSVGPDTGTSSSANPTPGGDSCSPPAGPESPSTRTYETWGEAALLLFGLTPPSPMRAESFRWHMGGAESNRMKVMEEMAFTLDAMPQAVLISSAEGSPAKTSVSPASDEASPEPAPGSSTSSPVSQTLFDPDGYSSRTYPDCSPAMAGGTSESCLERWPTSGTAWRGGFSTHVSSECRSDDAGCSSSEPSLTEILEPPASVPGRYSLSARAARGILRRAERREKTLPAHLEAALAQVAAAADSDTTSTTTPALPRTTSEPVRTATASRRPR